MERNKAQRERDNFKAKTLEVNFIHPLFFLFFFGGEAFGIVDVQGILMQTEIVCLLFNSHSFFAK